MKKIIIASCLLIIASQTMAQFNHSFHSIKNDDDNGNYGFNKQSLFAGGTVGLGADGYSFNAGATPEIGFTVQKWLDVGALVNLNYYSQRADPN